MSPTPTPRRRAGPWLALHAGMLLLAGCGGGIDEWFSQSENEPPTIALAAAPTPVAPGQMLVLVAAASDDEGIDEVAFFRVEADGALTRLGADGEAPFLWTQEVASGATGTLRYQARATDTDGKSTDSLIVEVEVSE
ncbi:hypothetical protein [Rivibacter subsaxonicus]|nr:hypothetical protein [Rivibacter subsaxonicus]